MFLKISVWRYACKGSKENLSKHIKGLNREVSSALFYLVSSLRSSII